MAPKPISSANSLSGKPRLKVTAPGRNNTIGMAERELIELLELLDETETGADTQPRRDFARWPFRQSGLEVTLIHPGGSTAVLKLACRNISRGGASLLHSGFVYPGTPCRIRMPKVNGEITEIAGKVCRCQHRSGALHELGVKFNKPLDLDRYVVPNDTENFHVFECVDPASIKGNLLLADNCVLTTKLLKHHLRETSLVISSVTTGADAIGQAIAGFDLVVIAALLPDMDAVTFIRTIRGDNVTIPVLVLAQKFADPETAVVRTFPNVGLILKPIQQNQALRAIAECLLERSK